MEDLPRARSAVSMESISSPSITNIEKINKEFRTDVMLNSLEFSTETSLLINY